MNTLRIRSLVLAGCFTVFSSLALSAPPTPTVTVQIFGTGKVSSSPTGIACPGDCTEAYSKKTTVVLTAVPGYAMAFAGWGGACTGSQLTCSITVSSVTNVTADFEQRYPGPVAGTGQTKCFDSLGEINCAGSGQDGEYQAGVALPVPRFTDNGDGTVRDNLTGLIWMRDASCLGLLSRTDAFAAVRNLAAPSCGLSDGSTTGSWRMPNIRELLSLVDYTTLSPALPVGNPFINVQLDYASQNGSWYHSSSYGASIPEPPGYTELGIRFNDGLPDRMGGDPAPLHWHYVWPVRGP